MSEMIQTLDRLIRDYHIVTDFSDQICRVIWEFTTHRFLLACGNQANGFLVEAGSYGIRFDIGEKTVLVARFDQVSDRFL